jgi:hypothetical protein
MNEQHVKKIKTYNSKNQCQCFEWNRVELFFKNNSERSFVFKPDSLQDFRDNPSLSITGASFVILQFDLGIETHCDEVHFKLPYNEKLIHPLNWRREID